MTDPIARLGLGPRLNSFKVPDNPCLVAVEHDARKVIEAIVPNLRVEFAITESRYVQALANPCPPTILMAHGLADMMCRLAGALISAGVFVAFGKTEPTWSADFRRSASSLVEQLQQEPFRWHSAYLPWMDDNERQIIFFYLLLSISRFVVMHEVGHIALRHDRTADGKIKDSKSRQAAVTSQAKEIAADCYAFNTHLRYQDFDFNVSNPDPMRVMLLEKLTGTPRMRLRWTLLSAFLVFQLLDRHRWTLANVKLATHPPAPFRVKSLYATALELKCENLTEGEISEEVSVAAYLGNAILGVGLDRHPNLSWMQQVQGPEFDAMFMDISDELPKWIDPGSI